MNQPTLSVIPMHKAIASGRSVTLDILVKIEPPAVEVNTDRPPLNLGFVVDRSGSMSGDKIEYARQAIAYAVQQLLPSDRLSLTLFDTNVETKIPSTLATDKQKILDIVRRIRTGSSTALYDGWVNGGNQVKNYLNPEHLNRVILLSDGLANVGETNPDAISTEVHNMMQKGITSSAFGVGDDYDEDMLEAMARSGDGNFFHIDSPDQLPEIFEVELQGLLASLGKSVKLALLPLQGTVLSQVLNDLEQDEEGAIKLPNLTVGNTLKVVLRLRIPALTESSDVLNLKLSWQSIEDNVSQIVEGNLRLEVVSAEQMSEFPANPEVQEQVALLMAARARQEAIDFGDRGDWQEAIRSLKSSSAMLENMESTAAIADELTNLNELTSSYESGDYKGSRKRAMSEKYQMNRSRPSSYGKKRPE